MSYRCILALTCLLLLLAPLAVHADFYQTFNGATNRGGMFDRPSSACTATTTSVRYQAQTFVLQNAANCTIVSSQDYDGYIHLYSGGFNPNNPTNNCVTGDDDGELGIGTSRIPADLNTNSMNLAAGTYTLVSSAFNSPGVGSFQNTIHCNLTQPIHGDCFFNATARDQQVCHHERFAVRILNITNHPSDGVGTPVRAGSTDSSIWWFYNDRNYEVMLKVLDACAGTGYYWVFLGALTNQGYAVQVGDVLTQQVNTYPNPQGTRAPAVTDTQAFLCDPP